MKIIIFFLNKKKMCLSKRKKGLFMRIGRVSGRV